MCGIVYCENLKGKPVNRLIREQFNAQRDRGVQGFGLYDLEYKNMVRTPKERKMMSWLKRHNSTAILFHHRFPTSTENVKNACHPFSTKDFFKTNYILVHNGCISNADTLKAKHEKLGISYSSVQKDGSFNDSEALLWDFALYMEGKQTKLEASGSIALVCIAMGKSSRHLHFARNYYSPLNMHRSNKYFMLSSEGKGDSTNVNTLYSYDYTSQELTEKLLTIPSYDTSYSSGYSSGYYGYYGERYDDDYGYKPYANDKSVLCLDDLGSAINEGGKLVDLDELKIEIQKTYTQYMTWAWGYFEPAIEYAEDDLTSLREQLCDKGNTKTVNKYLLQRIEIVKQAIDLIDLDVNYTGPQAYDVSYFNKADKDNGSRLLTEGA